MIIPSSSKHWLWFSSISFSLVLVPLLLAMVSFAAYISQAQWLSYIFDTYTWRVVWFSWWQASLSTLISVSSAVLVARALARRQSFLGRWLLLRCFSVALVVPTIIAVGVASPSAQGQEINNTVTALISAKIKSSKSHQVSNRVRILISTTIGTNILETLSAIL